ncbi:MAG: hypothetical protein ACR2N4_06190 [Jatrophihabitans sp.]
MPIRPISHRRGLAAAQVLVSVTEELRDQLPPSDKLAPRLQAGRILEADDERGTRAGLVVQSDDVRWAAIDGLLDLAVYGMLAHRRLAHDGRPGTDCPMCQQAEAMWHNTLIGRVMREDVDASSELRDTTRATVEWTISQDDPGWRG